MLSFWFQTKLSHLLPLDVMLTKSVNIQHCSNRHGRIPCFCSISLCSNYQFDLFVHIDPYSPLNYPRIMFQEAPDTRRKTIADVLWNNCWPDGPKWRPWVEGCLLLEEPTSHAWELWPEPLTVGAKGLSGQAVNQLLRVHADHHPRIVMAFCSVSLSKFRHRLGMILELRKHTHPHTRTHLPPPHTHTALQFHQCPYKYRVTVVIGNTLLTLCMSRRDFRYDINSIISIERLHVAIVL